MQFLLSNPPPLRSRDCVLFTLSDFPQVHCGISVHICCVDLNVTVRGFGPGNAKEKLHQRLQTLRFPSRQALSKDPKSLRMKMSLRGTVWRLWRPRLGSAPQDPVTWMLSRGLRCRECQPRETQVASVGSFTETAAPGKQSKHPSVDTQITGRCVDTEVYVQP